MSLTAVSQSHGRIVIDPDQLPTDGDQFSQQLAASLVVWQQAGHKTAWLQIPTSHAQLIPPAITAGFELHHCGPDYLMLTYRLLPETFVPPHATHYVGAGGVVINEQNELLVIVEKSHAKKRPNYYKLPGGALEANEHLADGVRREVLEETGIETTFHSLVCLRHWHNYRFGKSDLYFVCRLTPTSSQITLEEAEIAKCQWMPVDTYLQHPEVAAFNKRIVSAALQNQGLTLEQLEGYSPIEREFFFIDGRP